MGHKMSPKQFLSGIRRPCEVWKGEVDRLVAILKTNNCGGGGDGGGSCGIHKQSASMRAAYKKNNFG